MRAIRLMVGIDSTRADRVAFREPYARSTLVSPRGEVELDGDSCWCSSLPSPSACSSTASRRGRRDAARRRARDAGARRRRLGLGRRRSSANSTAVAGPEPRRLGARGVHPGHAWSSVVAREAGRRDGTRDRRGRGRHRTGIVVVGARNSSPAWSPTPERASAAAHQLERGSVVLEVLEHARRRRPRRSRAAAPTTCTGTSHSCASSMSNPRSKRTAAGEEHAGLEHVVGELRAAPRRGCSRAASTMPRDRLPHRLADLVVRRPSPRRCSPVASSRPVTTRGLACRRGERRADRDLDLLRGLLADRHAVLARGCAPGSPRRDRTRRARPSARSRRRPSRRPPSRNGRRRCRR